MIKLLTLVKPVEGYREAYFDELQVNEQQASDIQQFSNIEIEDDLSFRKYIVTTTSNTLEIIPNSEEKIFKPMIKLEENLVLFNMLNLKNGEIELAFNNEQGNEIYFEKIQNTTTIHKSFDLSKLPSGNYHISVKTKAKVFNLEVNLK